MKSPILATLMIGIAGLATGTVVVSQTSQDSGQDQRILKGSVADPAPYTPAGSYKSIPLEEVDRGMQHKVCLSQFRSQPSTIWGQKDSTSEAVRCKRERHHYNHAHNPGYLSLDLGVRLIRAKNQRTRKLPD